MKREVKKLMKKLKICVKAFVNFKLLNILTFNKFITLPTAWHFSRLSLLYSTRLSYWQSTPFGYISSVCFNKQTETHENTWNVKLKPNKENIRKRKVFDGGKNGKKVDLPPPVPLPSPFSFELRKIVAYLLGRMKLQLNGWLERRRNLLSRWLCTQRYPQKDNSTEYFEFLIC